MAKWTAFPYDADAYTYDATALKKHWARLHKGEFRIEDNKPGVLAVIDLPVTTLQG